MERPLIVITPKSLLRLPAAAASLEDLTTGGFLPVIDDVEVKSPETVTRIVLCSGKVYYDLMAARKERADSASADVDRVAIVRLEQFYPFPQTRLHEILGRYSAATELVWAQEEPKNMGGWTFVEPRLVNFVPSIERPIYVGRSASASPATGSYAIHQAEQAELISKALSVIT